MTNTKQAIQTAANGAERLQLPNGDFVPGMYLKKGYVITSRGCDKSCRHCLGRNVMCLSAILMIQWNRLKNA